MITVPTWNETGGYSGIFHFQSSFFTRRFSKWSENGAVDTINNLSSSGGDTLGFTASKLKCLLCCNNIAVDRPVTNQTTAEMSFPANAAVLI